MVSFLSQFPKSSFKDGHKILMLSEFPFSNCFFLQSQSHQLQLVDFCLLWVFKCLSSFNLVSKLLWQPSSEQGIQPMCTTFMCLSF